MVEEQTLTLIFAACALLCACRSKREQAAITEPLQLIHGLSLTETSNSVKEWTLDSVTATLREEGGDVELDKPIIGIFKQNAQTTRADSDTGRFNQNSHDLHMQGHVVVVTKDEDSPTKILTEALDYVSAKKQFVTNEKVTIEQQGRIMHGKGMVANEDLSEIHVLHQETNL